MAWRSVSALRYSSDVFVVNSFSKYYGMTGWRLGWIVAPPAYLPALEKLAQNIFLAASTPAQHAALAAFTPAVQRELERRRDIFVSGGLSAAGTARTGFCDTARAAGAFYLYADGSRFTDDSERFARELLEQAGVAITPGLDFSRHRARQHVRFSYATTRANLEEACAGWRNSCAGVSF